MTRQYTEHEIFSHPAIDELYQLVDNPDIDSWIQKWIVGYEDSQLIVNRKAITSEAEDTLKELIAVRLLEKAMNDCVDIKVSDTKIEANLLILRRNRNE